MKLLSFVMVLEQRGQDQRRVAQREGPLKSDKFEMSVLRTDSGHL